MLRIASTVRPGKIIYVPRRNTRRLCTKPAPSRYAHGWDSYTYINTAVDLRLVRGFNLLLQSERERRAAYSRYSQQLVFPTDDPESAAAEKALEEILDEDPPLSVYPSDPE